MNSSKMAENFLTTDELRKLSPEDLQIEIDKTRHNLNTVHISIRTGKEKATHKAQNLKRHVARTLTIQNEKARAMKNTELT